MAFPVCTDLAVSGAAHFKRKAERDPLFQRKAANYAYGVLNCFKRWTVHTLLRTLSVYCQLYGVNLTTSFTHTSMVDTYQTIKRSIRGGLTT